MQWTSGTSHSFPEDCHPCRTARMTKTFDSSGSQHSLHHRSPPAGSSLHHVLHFLQTMHSHHVKNCSHWHWEHSFQATLIPWVVLLLEFQIDRTRRAPQTSMHATLESSWMHLVLVQRTEHLACLELDRAASPLTWAYPSPVKPTGADACKRNPSNEPPGMHPSNLPNILCFFPWRSKAKQQRKVSSGWSPYNRRFLVIDRWTKFGLWTSWGCFFGSKGASHTSILRHNNSRSIVTTR